MCADPATDDLTLDWPAAPGCAGPECRRAPAPGNAERTRAEATAQPAAPAAEAGLAETGLPLSALLRGLGAAVVIGAFVLYLFQGWRGGDDLTRALLLLGHTVALTAAGFGLGHWLREPRGARLFIALALAAMPVSFAFLGGLLYGHIGGAQPDPAAPGFWQSSPGGALGLGPVLLLTLAATAVLTLAIGIGFLVLALLGYGVLRQAIDAGTRWPQLLETAAAAMACAAAGSVLLVLAPLTGVADAAKLPLAALVLAGLLLDLGNRPIHARPAHRSAAAALIASVTALNLLAHGGLGPAAGAVAAGIGALAAGYGLRRRALFLLGIAVALLGLGCAGEAMLARFTLGTWTLLVLLGSASIVAGSVVERHGTALRALLARGRQHFKAAA